MLQAEVQEEEAQEKGGEAETCEDAREERGASMNRIAAMIAVGLTVLVCCASAEAAVPVVSPVSATDLQGVSAVVKGGVDGQGLATTYHFEYVTQAAYESGGYGTAASTPPVPVPVGGGTRPARAALSSLSPSTPYRYRLVATNSSGSSTAEGSFSTTQGFGLRPGTEGFGFRAIGEGGTAATGAGSHPYQLNLSLGFNQGGEFEDQPSVAFP